MQQEVGVQLFLDGLAVGELTGRLKYDAPAQLKLWVALSKLGDFKGVLQKYNYQMTGLTAHPSDPDQVLIVAEKGEKGTNPQIVLSFAKGDRFMDGWHTGCLSAMLHYTRPEQFEEWIKVDNLDAIQRLLDKHHYTISSLRVHPEDKKWLLVVACKDFLD